jgi:ABC-type transport system involved in multi-copper enzyme maturation permease subunit
MSALGEPTVEAHEADPIAPTFESGAASARAKSGLVSRILTVIRFEMRRTRTDARAATWLIMVLFPAGLLALYRLEAETTVNFEPPPEQILGIVLYGLIPQVVCLLGLLLWVAPVLQAELEGRTWIYLAVRPGGKFATLIGKYLNGIAWTASAALLGLTIGMLAGQLHVSQPIRLWCVIASLVLFSCFAYGAAYSVIGAVFHRKAMVVSVAYILIFEVVISNLPAMINRFTVQHHLFNLLFHWMDWDVPPDVQLLVGSQPAWQHVAALVAYTLVMLTTATLILRWRQYVTSDEN